MAQRERARFGSEGLLVRIQSSRPFLRRSCGVMASTSDFLSGDPGSLLPSLRSHHSSLEIPPPESVLKGADQRREFGRSAKFSGRMKTLYPGGPTVRTPDFDSGSEGSTPSPGTLCCVCVNRPERGGGRDGSSRPPQTLKKFHSGGVSALPNHQKGKKRNEKTKRRTNQDSCRVPGTSASPLIPKMSPDSPLATEGISFLSSSESRPAWLRRSASG